MLRLRVKFGRGREVMFISHLDIIRLWERVFRRAEVPLAYTEGFNPHPRISLAAPLAVGVTSDAELMDVYLKRWMSPHAFTSAVTGQLPAGIQVLGAVQVAPALPSLQAQVRFAEYRVEIQTGQGTTEIESALSRFLSLKHLPWHHQRDTGERNYDLRLLVDDVWLMDCTSAVSTLGMRLRCDSGGAGRPEQVVLALGFTGYPLSVHRTRLMLELDRKPVTYGVR